jgi:hypothetical protein
VRLDRNGRARFKNLRSGATADPCVTGTGHKLLRTCFCDIVTDRRAGMSSALGRGRGNSDGLTRLLAAEPARPAAASCSCRLAQLRVTLAATAITAAKTLNRMSIHSDTWLGSPMAASLRKQADTRMSRCTCTHSYHENDVQGSTPGVVR